MKFYITLILLFINLTLLAQKYGSAVGIRIDDAQYGISLKQRIFRNISAEVISKVKSNSFQFSILPKYHFPILGKGINLYLGTGMHYGRKKEMGLYYGYDLLGGVELKIPALPIIISTDINPSYHINHSDWFSFSTGISIHYILSKETREKRQRARKKKRKRKERRERRENRRNLIWPSIDTRIIKHE